VFDSLFGQKFRNIISARCEKNSVRLPAVPKRMRFTGNMRARVRPINTAAAVRKTGQLLFLAAQLLSRFERNEKRGGI
jgi:hypothetical protein